MTTENKKMFFGWTNIKWFIREIIKMYSDQPSYLSKKRIESGIAFIILQWGLIRWMVLRIETIASSDLLIWSGIECAICGYMISHIQKEKKDNDIPDQ